MADGLSPSYGIILVLTDLAAWGSRVSQLESGASLRKTRSRSLLQTSTMPVLSARPLVRSGAARSATRAMILVVQHVGIIFTLPVFYIQIFDIPVLL